MENENKEYLFNLDNTYKNLLKEGDVDQKLVVLFKENKHNLSDKSKIIKEENKWILKGVGKEYIIIEKGNELQVFLNLFFSVDAGIKSIVGKDLITDDITAVFELVKNSFDAGSKKVYITFLDIFSPNSNLIIEDDGCGMSLEDIENKWMRVGYSDKTQTKKIGERALAGAKGIGRFSCDRLGRNLLLQTKTADDNKVNNVEFDWSKFEVKERSTFSNIPVKYYISEGFEDKKLNKKKENGTTLIISNLRSSWNREKIENLKGQLSRFINPIRNDFEDFLICLYVPELSQKEIKIENKLFEEMDSYIVKSSIGKNGEIEQVIIDDQKLVSHKKYKNDRYSIIQNTNLIIYYLGMKAKNRFRQQMGITFKDFGSVFLYRSGFRIRPYGEPGNDWLDIDVRKSQHGGSYLGNRDIVGYVDITDTENSKLKDISSRQGLDEGSIDFEILKNFVFDQFKDLEFYWKKCKEVKKKDTDFERKAFTNIDEYLKNIEDKEIREYIKNNIKSIMEISKKKDETIEAEKTKNEFLLASSRSNQAYINCIHAMNLYSNNISDSCTNIINYLFKEYGSKKTSKRLLRWLKNIQEDAARINTVARLSRAADFNMRRGTITGNILKYFQEYLDKISKTKTIDISYEFPDDEFNISFNPVEISILCDNFISNSKKAHSENIRFIGKIDNDVLSLEIIDDGLGILESKAEFIFDLGYTTTKGSGVGLFHVKEIIQKMNGNIEYSGKGIDDKGAKFIIELKGGEND